MIFIPLPKVTEGYKKGGLQWGPYGRSADEELQHEGVSEEVLALTARHAVLSKLSDTQEQLMSILQLKHKKTAF